MIEDRTREIMAQTAFKCASWLHAAEVHTGSVPDTDHLYEMARKIANGMFKLAAGAAFNPQQAGGPPRQVPRVEGPEVATQRPPTPSCPRCNEPMEFNQKSVGTNKPTWRCSQRGKFILDSKKWTGCDGVRWEDAA